MKIWRIFAKICRKGMTSVYDGIEDRDFGPVLLDLRSVERVGSGTVWLRYSMK